MWRVGGSRMARWRMGVMTAGALGASSVAVVAATRTWASNSEASPAAAEAKEKVEQTKSNAAATAVTAASGGGAVAKAPKSALDKVDAMFRMQYQQEFEVYELLKLLEKDYPFDEEVLIRLARISRQRWKDDWLSAVDRRKSGVECFDYASRAVAANKNSAEAHKWFAIGLVSLADAEGCQWPFASNAAKVKEELDIAHQLDPHDPSVLHLLGHWHYYFADLGPRRRMSATMKVGKLPRGSFEEALKLFEEAEKSAPGFSKKNDAFTALTLARLNQWPRAYALAEQVSKSPSFSIDDVEANSLVAPYLLFNKHRSAPWLPPT